MTASMPPERPRGQVVVAPCTHGHAVDMWNSLYPPPQGEVLHYTEKEWEAFVLGVKAGEFDDMANGETGAEI